MSQAWTVCDLRRTIHDSFEDVLWDSRNTLSCLGYSSRPPASPQPLAHLQRLKPQRLAHHDADAVEDLVRLALVHVRRRRHHHVLGIDADAVEGRRLVRAAVRLDGAP